MTTMSVSGWMFLLVPAHPGRPGQIPQSRKTDVFLLYIFIFCIFPFFVLYWFYLRTSDAFINNIIVIVECLCVCLVQPVNTLCVRSRCLYMKCSTTVPSATYDSVSVHHQGLPFTMLSWALTTTWRYETHEIHVKWFYRVYTPSLPLQDSMWAMMFVWRLRGKIIGTVLCYVGHDSCAQWYAYAHICEQFYHAMNYSAWHGLAIASVRLPIWDVGGS